MCFFNLFKKKNAQFILDYPHITITDDFLLLKTDLRKADISYKKVTSGYICFSGKIPGYDTEIEIGIHALGTVITSIEIFRPVEYYQSSDFDIYRSYKDFSSVLEKQYGKPLIRLPKDSYGQIREKWVKPYKIDHYIFERFGLEEHLTISL